MRLDIALAAAALVSAAAATPQAQAATIELKDAVARVIVVPEDRADIKVEIISANPRLPLTVRTAGDRTIVDGDLDRKIRNCNGGERGKVRVSGVGDVHYADMPQVVIRTPRAVSVVAGGAVRGSIGRSASLEMRNSGCSAWTVADVAGDAILHQSGAGSVRMGAASRLDVHLSGAGGISATKVRQSLAAKLSGAGGVRVEDLSGTMDAQVSGVGQIKVAGGRAERVRASVSGIGGVEFGGVANDLDASISGLGGVRVHEVTGAIRKSVSGGGSVSVGNRRI